LKDNNCKSNCLRNETYDFERKSKNGCISFHLSQNPFHDLNESKLTFRVSSVACIPEKIGRHYSKPKLDDEISRNYLILAMRSISLGKVLSDWVEAGKEKLFSRKAPEQFTWCLMVVKRLHTVSKMKLEAGRNRDRQEKGFYELA
jgi:hypothetical protein